ncbi:MAG: histidine phosphatase family protein [Calothrix sp. C42_A2020_038]|nr:histidine phosphatase family protein [Calothrix sp. C42_A2020_038]
MGQTVWIARHGVRLDFVNPSWLETAERFYDSPLSVDGFKQAQTLGKYLRNKGITHIFCSPFRRTVQTAHCVAEILDLSVKVESGLSEFLLPLWLPSNAEKFSIYQLASEFPRIDLQYNSRVLAKYPEITWQQILTRAGNTAKALVAEFPENILMVAHEASVVGAVQGLIGNAVIDASELCCLFQVHETSSHWSLEQNDYTPNPRASSSILPFSYYYNHIKRRLQGLWD